MKVDIFDFELDRSLIAKQPASPRDTSRLLDLSEEDKIADRRFTTCRTFSAKATCWFSTTPRLFPPAFTAPAAMPEWK